MTCKTYLLQGKWGGGSIWAKYDHITEFKKSGHKYHFYSCGNMESAKAKSFLHKLKFVLCKTFFLILQMTTSTECMSIIKIGMRYRISYTTAWFLMQKLHYKMQDSKQHLLTDRFNFDEFVVDGKQNHEQWISYDTKKKKAEIVMGFLVHNKVRRDYISIIQDYLSPTCFKKDIAKNCDIGQVPSIKSRNFKLNIEIRKIKSWFGRIILHINRKPVQTYSDKFCCRINIFIFKESIFHNIIQRMIQGWSFTNLCAT